MKSIIWGDLHHFEGLAGWLAAVATAKLPIKGPLPLISQGKDFIPHNPTHIPIEGF